MATDRRFYGGQLLFDRAYRRIQRRPDKVLLRGLICKSFLDGRFYQGDSGRE